MTKSKRLILTTLLVLVAVLATTVLAACGTKYAVTWDVSEHATVTVDGAKNLPADIAADSTITFTVQPAAGYEISAVRVNGRAITKDKSGNYNTIVKSDITIKVETVEKVKSVSVSTKPTTLTYYAGEEVDTTGMVVEVNYETGTKKVVTDYTIEYPSNTGVFVVGDTEFAVAYNGITSEPVALAAAVEVKVAFDPKGGKIDDAYVAALRGNKELHNVTVADDGVVSFTYAEITAPIALPTAAQWTKGQFGDYRFVGWTGIDATEIAVTNNLSVTLTVSYKAGLLNIDTVGYKLEKVKEGDVEVEIPFLVIAGKFNAATEAYLYLYEGNDDVEFVGDTVGGEGTKRGDAFELKFDMRKLTAAELENKYEGKWMDIKFVAVENGQKEVMEIDFADYEDVSALVDTNQAIVSGDYIYNFRVYDDRYLKAVYAPYFYNDYTMTSKVDDSGNVILTISGNVSAEKYAGKTVTIDFWTGATYAASATIDAEGKYTVSLNLSEQPLSTDGYAHIAIYENEGGDLLFKDGNDGNLSNDTWKNAPEDKYTVGLIEDSNALRCANTDGTKVYYVGKGKWGGIVIYGKNESILQTGVTLTMKNDKPCIEIDGTYGSMFTQETAEAKLKDDLKADLQNNADGNSGSTNPDWGEPTALSLEAGTIIVEVGTDGTWKVFLDLSARENVAGERLFSHYNGGNLVSDNIAEASITYNGLKYTLGVFIGWYSNLVTIIVAAAE